MLLDPLERPVHEAGDLHLAQHVCCWNALGAGRDGALKVENWDLPAVLADDGGRQLPAGADIQAFAGPVPPSQQVWAERHTSHLRSRYFK